jgi:hypothetical protein
MYRVRNKLQFTISLERIPLETFVSGDRRQESLDPGRKDAARVVLQRAEWGNTKGFH